MTKLEITDHLLTIIESPLLQERLELISRNYPNQKQELHIRNAILEIFNECNTPSISRMRAVAESRINGNKVDLCFFDQQDLGSPFKVEFKYQFSKDFNRFKNYKSIIEKDFEKRKSDAFVLITAHWNKENKKEFDQLWNITPDLNKYICNHDPEKSAWVRNIEEQFSFFEPATLECIKREVEKPYPVIYKFYVLLREPGKNFRKDYLEDLYGNKGLVTSS